MVKQKISKVEDQAKEFTSYKQERENRPEKMNNAPETLENIAKDPIVLSS
jgi:hypothetical protein